MVQPLTKVAVYSSEIETPLGPLLAITHETGVRLLEFYDRPGLKRELDRLAEVAEITPGQTEHSANLRRELDAYFAGERAQFETPLVIGGSDFQRRVWTQLQRIEPGETWSYADLAVAIGSPNSVRAVAGANGANQLALLIPCHRVIASGGGLGGYAGGVTRKQWLLEHERKFWGSFLGSFWGSAGRLL